MVDHVVNINNSVGGQMMIQDDGVNVAFWIRSGNSQSWDGELDWEGNVNGQHMSGVFNYPLPGATWRRIGIWAVSTNQTVYFNKTSDSGSSGLGTATNMSANISRSTVPGETSPVMFSEITHNSVKTVFVGYSDGGSPMLEWEITFGTILSGPWGNTVYSNGLTGTRVIEGLQAATTYGGWARGRNANGWGPYSQGAFFTTGNLLPGAPTSAEIRDITHYSQTFQFWDPPANGGSPITARQYQIAAEDTFSGSMLIEAPANGIINRTDLVAGTPYYWRARVGNAAGWGEWSVIRGAYTYHPPLTPTSYPIFNITHTSMTFAFADHPNTGGYPILRREYQAWFDTSFSGAGIVDAGNGTVVLNNLTPGTPVYFRGRTVNAAGASPWSEIHGARTFGGAIVQIGGGQYWAVPYVRVNGVWREAWPYVKKNGTWVST